MPHRAAGPKIAALVLSSRSGCDNALYGRNPAIDLVVDTNVKRL